MDDSAGQAAGDDPPGSSPDHGNEQQHADHVGDEPGDADEQAPGQHDDPVEGLATGWFTLGQALLGPPPHPKACPADQPRTGGADGQKGQDGRAHPNGPGHLDEGHHLGRDQHHDGDQDGHGTTVPRQGAATVLIVRPIGPGAGRYYATSPRPGRWVGGGAAALGLSGAVDLGELAEVLAGRHPLGPGPLGDPRHPRRRAGWDLTFAAPKGVSLVAELTAEAGVAAAHRAAVDEALGFAGRHACWAQSANRLVNAGSGMLAARFEHDRSAAGDPHLHTHVLLVNALRSEDGMWSAVTSSPLWRSERELSTIYRLGLRHHMAQAGLHPAWSLGAEGSADLAGIPPAAITASSRRRTQMAAHRAAGRDATGASAARAVTRGRGGEPAPEGWRAAVAAAGLDRERADALLGAGTPPREPELDAGSVSAALAEKASSFTVRDVIRAIGATSPTGMAAPTAEAFADRFCTAAIVVGPGRWTTAQAQAADRDVVELMARRPHDALGLVAPRRLEAAAADPNLDGAGRAGIRRLLGGGRAVDVVAGAAGHDRLDVQAALIDGARRAWQASGYQVAVAGGGRRWEALAAVPDERRVAAPVQILVVDRADRLSPPQLLSVLRRAASEATKVVLVEGGTLPLRHRPFSAGLVAGADRLGRVEPGRLSALPTLHHAPVMTAGGTAVVSSGRDAVAHLLGLWQRAAPTQRPLLVGAGPPEVALSTPRPEAAWSGRGGSAARPCTPGAGSGRPATGYWPCAPTGPPGFRPVRGAPWETWPEMGGP